LEQRISEQRQAEELEWYQLQLSFPLLKRRKCVPLFLKTRAAFFRQRRKHICVFRAERSAFMHAKGEMYASEGLISAVRERETMRIGDGEKVVTLPEEKFCEE
jgi:hypothetical protein